MKKIIQLLLLIMTSIAARSQVSLPSSLTFSNTNQKKDSPRVKDSAQKPGGSQGDNSQNENILSQRMTLYGLGNISSTLSGDGIKPSANILADILPFDRKLKLTLAYNLATELDSTRIDSIQLSNLFMLDNSRSGFFARVGYNLLKSDNDIRIDRPGGYTIFNSIEPFIEYDYFKLNIKSAHKDSSKIQTSSLVMGCNFSRFFKKEENFYGIAISPFFKITGISDATVGLYRSLFKNTIEPQKNPNTFYFWGVNTSMQINRFVFTFIYNRLLNESLRNTPIWGGQFTLRATVSGDFFKL